MADDADYFEGKRLPAKTDAAGVEPAFRHHHLPYQHPPVPYYDGVVFTGWWFPWRYSGRKTWFGYAVCLAGFFLFLFIVFLTVALTTEHDNRGQGTQFSPKDTEIIRFSQSLCEGIEIHNQDLKTPATIYRLSKPPKLSVTHNVTISGQRSVSLNSYFYWYYYIHAGSTMSLTACLTDASQGAGLGYYVVRSVDDFKDWTVGDSDYEQFHLFDNLCPNNHTIRYDITSGNEYFFAFTSENGRSVGFDYKLQFYFIEYGIEKDDVEAQCSAGGTYSGHCMISMPYGGDHTVLLTVGDTTSPQGSQRIVPIQWSCHPRIWVYLMAFMFPPLVAMVLMTIVVCLCYRCQNKRRISKRYYSSLQNEAFLASTNSSTMTSFMGPPSPPPYENTNSHTYGATNNKLPQH